MKLKLNVCFVLFLFFSYRQRQSSDSDFIETDPLQIFLAAVENSKPVIGVRGTKKGGKVYQVSNTRATFANFCCNFQRDFFSHALQPAAVSE